MATAGEVKPSPTEEMAVVLELDVDEFQRLEREAAKRGVPVDTIITENLRAFEMLTMFVGMEPSKQLL